MKRGCSTAALAASLVLVAGCNQRSALADGNQATANAGAALPALPASLPLQPGAATPVAAAPPVAALPVASRPPLHRLADPRASYAYLDRAASYDDAVGDAPPDYAFGYNGVNPWGWQAQDGSSEYAEPVEGGYRYYYYEPGAATPYLVRDPGYSYAFDGAALVAIYDVGGRVLPPGAYGPRWDYAGRYFARAQALRAAAAERHEVIAANWAARRAQIAASNAAWDAARARDSAWAAYHAQAATEEQAHWQAERAARVQATQSFVAYRQRGFAGPPPAPPQGDRLPAAMAPPPGMSDDRRGAERQQAAVQQQQRQLAVAQARQAGQARADQQRQAIAAQRQAAVAQHATAVGQQRAARQQADAQHARAEAQHVEVAQARQAQATQRAQAAQQRATARQQQQAARAAQRSVEHAPPRHSGPSAPHPQPAPHPAPHGGPAPHPVAHAQPAPEARPHPEAPHAPPAPHPAGGGGEPHEHEHH